MNKKNYKVCKGQLIEFSYVFNPTVKYIGLVCEVLSDYSFEKMLYVLQGKSLETIPISVIYIIENYE